MSWSDFSSQPSRPPAGVTVDVCCWPLPAPLSSSDPPGNRTTATKRGRRWRTPWIGPGRSCRWTTCSMPWRSISDLFLDTSMARFAAPWARWRNWGNREATRVGVTLRCRIQCWSNTFHWGFSVVVSLFHFRCQVVMGQDSGPWYSGVSPSNEIIGFSSEPPARLYFTPVALNELGLRYLDPDEKNWVLQCSRLFGRCFEFSVQGDKSDPNFNG